MTTPSILWCVAMSRAVRANPAVAVLASASRHAVASFRAVHPHACCCGSTHQLFQRHAIEDSALDAASTVWVCPLLGSCVTKNCHVSACAASAGETKRTWALVSVLPRARYLAGTHPYTSTRVFRSFEPRFVLSVRTSVGRRDEATKRSAPAYTASQQLVRRRRLLVCCRSRGTHAHTATYETPRLGSSSAPELKAPHGSDRFVQATGTCICSGTQTRYR
jgi:hypothetical protein